VGGPGASVEGHVVRISAGGAYCVSGELADGMIEIDSPDKVILILNGAALEHADGPAINIVNGDLSLVLAEGTANTLADGKPYSVDAKAVICSNDSIEFSGGGALLLTGRYKHAVASDDSILVRGGDLTIASAPSDGLHADDNITVSGGNLTILWVDSDGLESGGDLIVDGGTLVLTVGDDGIIGQGPVTINGGVITVHAGVEGIESKTELVINGGDLDITVSDDVLNSTGVAGITINGGRLYLNGWSDAIDSNGALTINGGLTVALGGLFPEGGLDPDFPPVINGGILVATGGYNKPPDSSSAQRSVILGSRPVGAVIRIERDDGTDVLTFRVSRQYETLVFTSPALLPDTAHVAYSGGSVTGGNHFHGLYSGVGYVGGVVWDAFTTTGVVTYAGGAPPPP
jgi:hypothetical protein